MLENTSKKQWFRHFRMLLKHELQETMKLKLEENRKSLHKFCEIVLGTP